MSGTVEDEFNALVKALNESEYTKNEAVLILKEYVDVLIANKLIDGDRRSSVALVTMDFTKRVKRNDWKFAHGFFGNWAKSHAEAQQNKVPLDPFDVDEMGC